MWSGMTETLLQTRDEENRPMCQLKPAGLRPECLQLAHPDLEAGWYVTIGRAVLGMDGA